MNATTTHDFRGDAPFRAAHRSGIRRRCVLFGALLSLLIAPWGGLVAQPLPTLKIALVPGDIGAQAWYAEDLGYFKQEGLNVEISPIPSGAAIAAGVASHALDIGYSSALTLAIAHERGIPVVIIAPANVHIASAPTAGLLSVLASSPIRSGLDLEGKTIAVGGLANIIDYAVRAWIDSHGGDSSKAKYIQIPLTEQAPAVRAGRVDAASMDALGDPNLGKPGDNLRLLASTFNSVSPNFLVSAWFANKDWTDAHPELAKKFITAMHRASIWANGHHRESAEILARYTKMNVEQIEAVTRVTYGTVLNAGLLQPNIDVAVKYGALKNTFSAKDLISTLAGGNG